MKKNITPLIAAFFLFMGLSGLQAQQSILTSSSNATGNEGSVSYSVGQMVFHTYTGGGGIVTEGVQQPYEILFMEGIASEKGITLDCRIYPNPADAQVTLKIKNREIFNLSFQLKNLDGELLLTKNIESDETCIPLEELMPATYFLTVSGNGRALQTYKIIKK